MNTSYVSNSTPKTMNGSKYIDSLMDFSTPMSTVSKLWINSSQHQASHGHNDKMAAEHSSNSTIINETMTDTNNNSETILDKLLEKLKEHETSFHHTQNSLSSLDGHLREITTVLSQLQNSLDNHSLLKSTADQLETRVLQISTKREQIRAATDHLHQSPTVTQTLHDIIQQISPSPSKRSVASDPLVCYRELLNAVRLSMSQKSNLIERFHADQMHRKHRTNDFHLRTKQRQQRLLQLMEKLLDQQKQNESSIESHRTDKSQFDSHNEQLAELNTLMEEYQTLQDENRFLKQQAKANIKTLYTFISQAAE